MPDVFTVLGADHQKVLQALDALTASTTLAASKDELVSQLVIDESKHEAVEEMYFWPTVREKLPNGDELADHALQQEQEGEEVLDELRKSEPGDSEFLRLVAAFTTAGREHIAYEELQVWPALRTVLSPDEAMELGTEIESAKKTGPTRPHPGAPDSPGGLETTGMAAAAVDRARDAVARWG